MVRVLHVDYDMVDCEELADGVVYDSYSSHSPQSYRRKLETAEPTSYSTPYVTPSVFSGGRSLATKYPNGEWNKEHRLL